MNPASKDISDLLVAESSLALIAATNLFIGREPDLPAECVTLYDAAGSAPTLGFNQEESKYYRPGLVVRVRSLGYFEAHQLSFNIMQLLHGSGNMTINSTRYLVIRALADPQLLNWDDKERCIFITNYNIQRR